MVARTVLDTLRQVATNKEEIESVFDIVARLAQDVEPSVRAELMEQVPHIAMYCQEVPELLHHVVPTHLLPLVVKFLTDTNNQVRKTSQAALLVLLEQGLVEKSDVEKQVCPVIINFTEADSMDDYRTEAIALLSKMAPLIGREMSERLFLQRFAALCVDPLFHVRKVCAANFGDFSGVVGSVSTEQILLPKFFYLCEDGVWGVRKACADVFMPVSCVCSPTVRQTELSPVFINLLRDQSRWVRMAAFQALGPFISTFADPAITALLHNENGEIVITDPDQLADRLNQLELAREASRDINSSTCPTQPQPQPSECNSTSHNINNNTVEERTPSSTSNNENALNNNNTTGNSNDNDAVAIISMDEKEEEDAWSSQLVSSSTTDDDQSPEERRARLYLTGGGASSNRTSPAPTSSGNQTVPQPPTSAVNYTTFLFWREPLADLQMVDIDLEESTPAAVASVKEEEEEDVEMQPVEEDKSSGSILSVAAKEAVADAVIVTDKSEAVEEAQSSTDTGSQESSTMELFRPADKEQPDNISTFDPQQSRWESYSSPSLHSSRSSLDSRTTAELHPPDPALPKGPPETDQSIVPQLLIDHFVSMIDPSRAQTVDNDIARHCAFSLPAVALTLGRSNWPLLKETYETLANDMQWKVRRTLASSIHELGVILGKEVAAKDLVPIFNGFIKDLDEVRIGILKHLADFLKLLEEKERHKYLPKLVEFLKMDNDRNWRFRLELAEQLGLLVPLFSPQDAKAYLWPIALTLVQDKVSAVRCAATLVIATILRTLEPELTSFLVTDLAEKLAQSPHWARRQTFVMLCGELVQQLSYANFSQDLLPHLLDLSGDKVPNVRLQVARVLGQVLPEEHYADTTAAHHEQVVAALLKLAEDNDTDVREAAAAGHRVQAVVPPLATSSANTTATEGDEGLGGEEDEAGSSGGGSEPPSWAQIAAK